MVLIDNMSLGAGTALSGLGRRDGATTGWRGRRLAHLLWQLSLDVREVSCDKALPKWLLDGGAVNDWRSKGVRGIVVNLTRPKFLGAGAFRRSCGDDPARPRVALARVCTTVLRGHLGSEKVSYRRVVYLGWGDAEADLVARQGDPPRARYGIRYVRRFNYRVNEQSGKISSVRRCLTIAWLSD